MAGGVSYSQLNSIYDNNYLRDSATPSSVTLHCTEISCCAQGSRSGRKAQKVMPVKPQTVEAASAAA